MPETFDEETEPKGVEDDRPQKLKRIIPKPIIKQWLDDKVGKIPNLLKIDTLHIKGDNFRVNVWESKMGEERVVPSCKIILSYFVLLTPSNEIVDETIRKTSNVDLY